MTSPQCLIPAKFAAIAEQASKDPTRFSLEGVHLVIGDETCRAEATNGHTLVRVEFPKGAVADFPEIIPDQTSSTTSAIIPSKSWVEACGRAKKIRKNYLPILSHVAVVLNGHATLATTDLEAPSVATVKPIEGTFPNTDMILDIKKTPQATIYLDANLLASLAKTLGALNGDKQAKVKLEIFDEVSPIRLSTEDTDGAKVTALLMPMAPPRD